MNTIKNLAAALAALAAVSCVKDEVNPDVLGQGSYSASFSESQTTKAVLVPGETASLVEWEENDKVGIMAAASNLEYKASRAGSNTTLIPAGEAATASEVYAVYPYDATASLSGNVITTELPAEQTAVQNSFAAHLAVAHTTTQNLGFRNVCGLVKAKVLMDGVTKVVLEGCNGETVAGEIAVTVSDEPSWTAGAAASKTVALVAAEGTLAQGSYYFAVLPQTFDGGFTVKAYNGEDVVMTKTVDGPVTLERCGVVSGSIKVVTVSAIAPTVATAGEIITLTGTGFSETLADNVVTINGAVAEVTAATATTLSVTVPSGLSKSTDYTLTVNVPGADPVVTSPFRYYSLPTYKAYTWVGAGGTAGTVEGKGSAARVTNPFFLGFAPDGKLWTAFADNSNPYVCTIDASTAELKFLVPGATIGTGQYPYGGDFDSDGNLYITLKGSGKVAKCSADGVYEIYKSGLNNPMDLKIDAAGNKYIAERNAKQIRIIDKDDNETTVSLDFQPHSLALDQAEDNLFIGTNGSWKIYRMNLSSKAVEVVAGMGTKPETGTATNGTAGNALSATVGNAFGLYCDADGYLYYMDAQTCTFQVLVPGVGNDYTKGVVKTAYGTLLNNGAFGTEGGVIAKDASGNFYVTAKNKHKIVQLEPQN